MRRRLASLLTLLTAAALSSGCVAVGLSLLAVGAGVGGGTSVSYTLDSIAYKTFTTPEKSLQAATLKTLKRMDMEVKENTPTDSGGEIVAAAGDRTVEIEIDRLTTKASRMRVNVKRGWFLRDRATATEIIVQTERTLGDELVAAETETPSQKSSAQRK
jgi:uncharacterized protein DUF3568